MNAPHRHLLFLLGKPGISFLLVFILNKLGEYLVWRREEVNQLFVDVLEPVLECVLLEKDAHLAQRHFVQIGEDQADGLVGSSPQGGKLYQPSDYENQIVVVLLHYLGALLSHL